MVASGLFPDCERCSGKVTLSPYFPNNQYLRQIPVEDAIEMTDTCGGKQKRPRPVGEELLETSDDDLTRSN